jgi:hypothetical protein
LSTPFPPVLNVTIGVFETMLLLISIDF